jgi:hypothetical protein
MVAAALLLCAGCERRGASPHAEAPARTSPGAASPPPSAYPIPSVSAAPAPQAKPAPTSTPPATIAPVLRTGKSWPFHSWTRAEVVGFNEFPMTRGAPRFAYDERGFSPHVASHKPITEGRAKDALEIARLTGEVSVSKCPFPRHAVVLFDGDTPIASINVCFECGDIDAWPLWDAIDWQTATPAEQKLWLAREEKRQRAHPDALARWRRFFREEGLDPDKRYGPPRAE